MNEQDIINTANQALSMLADIEKYIATTKTAYTKQVEDFIASKRTESQEEVKDGE